MDEVRVFYSAKSLFCGEATETIAPVQFVQTGNRIRGRPVGVYLLLDFLAVDF